MRSWPLHVRSYPEKSRCDVDLFSTFDTCNYGPLSKRQATAALEH